MPAQRVQRDQPTDVHGVSVLSDRVEAADRLEIDEDVRLGEIILDHPQEIAPASHRCRAVGREVGNRIVEARRVDVGQPLHASASRIRSRVNGNSLIRRPVALNTALPTAATTGITAGSPTFFAPYGP